MAMTPDDGLMLAVLEWLSRGALRAINDVRESKHQLVNDYITRMLPRLVRTEAELAKLAADLKNGTTTWESVTGRFFILPSLNEGDRYVPVLKMKFDNTTNRGVLAGLFLINSWDGQKPKSLGFRAEEPHCSGDGKHDYYHAQFINEFEQGGRGFSFTHQLPNSALAFPLFADNRLQLFLSCLISIYGKAYVKNELLKGVGDTRLNKVIKEWRPSAWEA